MIYTLNNNKYRLSELQLELIKHFNPNIKYGFGFYFEQLEDLSAKLQNLIHTNPILTTYLTVSDSLNGYLVENINSLISFRKLKKNDMNQTLSEELRKPFDLYNSPFFRITIIEIAEKQLFCGIIAHPVIMDSESLKILGETLQKSIDTSVPSINDIIPCITQPARMRLKIAKYWKLELEGAPQVSAMPHDFSRSSKRSFIAKKIIFNIPDSTKDKLKELSSKLKVSSELLITTAFSCFIHSHTNQTDLVIGRKDLGRNELSSNSIGLFERLIPLRNSFQPNSSFQDLVQDNNKKWKKIEDMKGLNFGSVVEELNFENDLHAPVVQNVIHFHNDNHLEKNPSFKFIDLPLFFSQYDLELHIESKKQSLDGYFLFSSDLFAPETMERMAKRWITFLSDCVEKSSVSLQHLNVLPESEKNEILALESPIEKVDPKNTSAIKLFEKQVRASPNHTALYFGEESLSYKNLNDKANFIAGEILSHTSIKKPKIIVCLSRTSNYVISVLAILKAGGTFVPVDPSSPTERLEMIIRDVEPQLIITEALAKNKFKNFEDIPIYLTHNPVQELNEDIREEVLPDDTAYILYTSGSTGEPKGILIKQESLSNIILNVQTQTPLDENDSVLHHLSFLFDVSVINIFWPLTTGASIILVSESDVYNIANQISQIHSRNCTVITTTPAILNLLLDHIDLLKNSKIRMIRSAGEALKKEVYKKALRMPNCKVFNDYGPTECTIYSTTYQVTEDTRSHFAPIGKPFANYRAYILDKNGNLAPFGVAGELCIGGLGVAKGYLKKKQLTKEKFIKNPFDRKSIIYRTGDLARLLPDGNIDYIGRLDFQVKIRGFRVELGEIEHALHSHPEIKETTAIVYHDEQLEVPHLVAYYTCKGITVPSDEELLQFLFNKIPNYMIPQFYIPLKQFPLSINGKIDRSKLPHPEIHTTNQRAKTETEKKLVAMWKHLLKINSLGVNDNFFVLGGDSLIAAELIFEIEKNFGYKELTFGKISNYPTVAQLASIIEGKEDTDQFVLNICHKDIKKARSIRISYDRTITKGDIKSVLLTGSTGFLGTSLLKEILLQTNATVTCLIRGKNPQKQLENALKNYLPNHEIDFKRVNFIEGDLCKPLLGLSKKIFEQLAHDIDAIYHSGALVHHLHGYNSIRNCNVLSLLEMLKLAGKSKPKQLNFVSTVDAAFDRNEYGSIPETFPEVEPHGNASGYSLSKWVGEKIIQEAVERGFLATVFRPGNIIGDTKNGILPNEGYHFSMFLKGCYQLGAAPKMETTLNLIPVDFAAKTIVTISLLKQSAGRVFNIGLNGTPNYNEIFQIMAKCDLLVDIIDFDKWKSLLKQVGKENALFSLIHYYCNLIKPYSIPSLDIAKLKEVAKSHSIEIPTVDEHYIMRNLVYLEKWFHSFSVL